MCAPSQGAMLPYGLKIPSPYFPFGPSGGLTQAHLSALDFQRSQLNDYNVRVQLGLRNYQNSIGLSPFHAYITDPYTQAYFYKHDPRARFVQEEPKPSHSYIGLIGMAILNSKEKKLVLSDIYQWILDNYPYFRTRGPGWRNSIRHNLSLNDCFIKAGRSANGKGHYWAVHPANVEDFERGDFRRRRAQRKVRRHMGLSVPDDDDSPTPSPTQPWPHHDIPQDSDRGHLDPIAPPSEHTMRTLPTGPESNHLILPHPTPTYGPVPVQARKPSRKRLFDVASLLAPDDDDELTSTDHHRSHSDGLHSQQLHVSGFSFHPIHDIKQHDVKMKSATSDNSADSNGSNSTQDLTVDVNSTSSGSAKEMSYDSEDDYDNDEIQVTSGENSPAQGMLDNNCDTAQGNHAVNGKFVNTNGKNCYSDGKSSLEAQDQDSSKLNSSPYSAESKTENALDLSSPTQSGGEHNLDVTNGNVEDNKNFKLSSETLSFKENGGVRQSHHACINGNMHIKKEAEQDHFNCGHDDQKPFSDREVYTGTGLNGCEQDRRLDNEQKSSSYRDNLVTNGRCDPRMEILGPMSKGSRELNKLSAEKLHYFRPEPQDLRRPQSQDNFGVGDNGLPESDRTGQMDIRGIVSEQVVPAVSENIRGTGEHLRWTEMSKNVIPRDRMSAFSTLGARHHSMYSPFQLRNFSVGSHRLLPSVTPLRAGIPTPLLPMSASSTSASIDNMVKGMDSGVRKCSNFNNSNNNSSSSSSNGNNNSKNTNGLGNNGHD